jgi:hypothetical protein
VKMAQRMFVCHAKSDIEATSEIVDALEGALELKTGTLVASSLPGYASDVRGEGDLHATLTGAALMLALFTERSTYDPEFVFELGAAWALGIDVLPLLLGPTSGDDVPWPLRDRPSIRAQDPTAWNDLVHQLSSRLQVSVRDRVDLAQPLEVSPPSAASFFEPEPARQQPRAADRVAERELPEPEFPPELASPFQAQLEAVEALQAAYELNRATAEAEAALDSQSPAYVAAISALEADAAADAAAEAAADAEIAALHAADAASDAEAAAYAAAEAALDDPYEGRAKSPVSIVAPVMVPGAAGSESGLPADAFEPGSDVRPHLPSSRMALEAGRALSDCVFNREEGLDFQKELDEPFGRFVDAMGGSWAELSKLQDVDVWLGATENLLQNLPNEGRRIGAWYEVGYELAILHNLAGQGLFDTEEKRAEAERLWRKALERFLIRAENASIPYEDLARVLSLLENLVAPRSERDLANIARSLDELRTQAAGADRQHTAA